METALEAHEAWEHGIGWALKATQSHSELAVLLAIMIHPGGAALTRDLAEQAKVSRKTVMRSVARFEGRGLLTVQRSSGSASYYTPNIPDVAA